MGCTGVESGVLATHLLRLPAGSVPRLAWTPIVVDVHRFWFPRKRTAPGAHPITEIHQVEKKALV